MRKGVVGRERLRNESFPPGHADGGTRSEAENLQANVSDRSLPTNIGNSEQRSNNPVEESPSAGRYVRQPVTTIKIQKGSNRLFPKAHTRAGAKQQQRSGNSTKTRPTVFFAFLALFCGQSSRLRSRVGLRVLIPDGFWRCRVCAGAGFVHVVSDLEFFQVVQVLE